MEKYMKIAYKQALKAYKHNEIPVGALIIDKNGRVIAKSKNNRQKKHYLLGHAEINCIIKAEKVLKDWRLDGCTMYVTLEPCDMCKNLIKEARIDKTYYLLTQKNEKSTQNSSFLRTNDCKKLKDDYAFLLYSFFKKLRK